MKQSTLTTVWGPKKVQSCFVPILFEKGIFVDLLL